MSGFMVPLASGLIDIFMLLLLLWVIRHSAVLSQVGMRVYQDAIFVTCIVIGAEQVALFTENHASAGLRTLATVANIVGFTASTALPLLLAALFYERLAVRPAHLFWPVGMVAVVAVSSPLTGWLFYFSEDGTYHRGPLFLLFVAAYGYGLLLLLYANWRQLRRRSASVFLAGLILLVMFGTSLQVIVPSVHISWHCISFALVLYYIFQRELQFQYDVLTGTFNRAAYERHLRELERRGNAAVVVFDVDQFKEVNDQYGHAAGDRCLATSGRILRDCFAPVGECYRIGGDEFCVLGDLTEPAVLQECMLQMKDALVRERTNMPFLPRISYGSCLWQDTDGFDLSGAIVRADKNMYGYKDKAE